jgi:ribonuclease HI
MSEQPVVVFTDGAAKGNPGPGGWGVVISTPEGQVAELGGGAPHTTNNRMELSGAIAALTYLEQRPSRIAIYTDSTYVIQGITQWVYAWRRRGWKTAEGAEVMNRDLWERLSSLASARGSKGIEWHWVRGHIGTAGNERADEISVAFAMTQHVELYDGPLIGYDRPIFDLPEETSLPKRTSGPSGAKTTKVAAHAYLSVVDGVPMRHATWTECERRVKGRSGARFKKAVSESDVAVVLQSWGIDPGSV